MKGIVVPGGIVCAIALGCASPPTSRAPVSEIPPNPPLSLAPFEMDSTLTPDRVPPFQSLPLIVWGPPPAGVPHAERARTYDLEHQITTVRFDWPRQAVVGTTTLRIAGLPGATPLSSISIDAGDMRFERVAAGTSALKYDYNGSNLVVNLATPLRAGEKTEITIAYDGVNRTK